MCTSCQSLSHFLLTQHLLLIYPPHLASSLITISLSTPPYLPTLILSMMGLHYNPLLPFCHTPQFLLSYYQFLNLPAVLPSYAKMSLLPLGARRKPSSLLHQPTIILFHHLADFISSCEPMCELGPFVSFAEGFDDALSASI